MSIYDDVHREAMQDYYDERPFMDREQPDWRDLEEATFADEDVWEDYVPDASGEYTPRTDLHLPPTDDVPF